MTATTDTNELTRQLLAWHDELGWVNENASLMAAAIVELGGGEPVDPGRTAARAGRPTCEALDFLRGSPAQWDDRGRLVGFGLTLRQTRHRVTTEARTWCAPDALAFPVPLGAPAVIESPCFVSGEPIRIEVATDGVCAVEPPGAVVSTLPAQVGAVELRERLCHQQHFFASNETAQAWRWAREDVLVVPVADAFDPLRRLMLRWAGHDDAAA
jgi:alkylmercury lyase